MPHKRLIGQVILDVGYLLSSRPRGLRSINFEFPQKNASLRTVVNKLKTIDNEFRNFKMEVLAGDTDFVVNAVRRIPWFDVSTSLTPAMVSLQSQNPAVYSNSISPSFIGTLAYQLSMDDLSIPFRKTTWLLTPSLVSVLSQFQRERKAAPSWQVI